MKLSNIICGLVLTGYTIIVFASSDNLLSTESSAINAKFQALNGATRIKCTPTLRCSLSQTTQYYTTHDFQLVWSINGNLKPVAGQVINLLANAYQQGLDPNDYHIQQLMELTSNLAQLDNNSVALRNELLADLDVTLTDGYLLYAKHMASGRLDPKQAYPDWQVERPPFNALDFFQQALANQRVVEDLVALTPTFFAYQNLLGQLAHYQQLVQDGTNLTIPGGEDLKPGSRSRRVAILAQHLAQIESYTVPKLRDANLYSAPLVKLVRQFQSDNGLKVNGIVDKATLQALNLPPKRKLSIIELNLDRLRWLPREMGAQFVLVDIPNYSLTIYDNAQALVYMPVIVGGGIKNKTCLVASKITTLELNPYWGVPRRIATNEYLGKIQESPGFFSEHNIRVFDPKTNSEIDPATIDWDNVTRANFNYLFRQDPGKKNALGKIKFMFANNCGIYLHDTPNPSLFKRQQRSLSHGCVRVSQPMLLANYLIKPMPAWSSQRLESAINSGKHGWLRLSESLPIYITYQTAWVNESGFLQLRKDIYKADNVAFPLALPPAANHKNSEKREL